MTADIFRFKEFNIDQRGSAMKVGTDGVLLGAWTHIPEFIESALDIGTGTGLIALQLAQRCECPQIDALEFEDRAFEQAVENFENSPWSDRLFCFHASLQEFHKEMEETYDLIVCNPPFHNNSHPAMGAERNLARQEASLDFETLLQAVSDLLTRSGRCSFIIPFEREKHFVQLAQSRNLFPSRLTHVRGNAQRPVRRSLIEFSKQKSSFENGELVLELSRHVLTPQYKELVSDFYLKL